MSATATSVVAMPDTDLVLIAGCCDAKGLADHVRLLPGVQRDQVDEQLIERRPGRVVAVVVQRDKAMQAGPQQQSCTLLPVAVIRGTLGCASLRCRGRGERGYHARQQLRPGTVRRGGKYVRRRVAAEYHPVMTRIGRPPVQVGGAPAHEFFHWRARPICRASHQLGQLLVPKPQDVLDQGVEIGEMAVHAGRGHPDLPGDHAQRQRLRAVQGGEQIGGRLHQLIPQDLPLATRVALPRSPRRAPSPVSRHEPLLDKSNQQLFT